MVTLSKSKIVWLALSSGTILVACNAVLGITEATVDPLLGTGGATGSASSATSTSATTGTGGGASSSCVTYCQTMIQNCTGDNQEYSTQQVCESMCAFFEPGTPGDMTNDTLACRASHAALAATDPIVHCRQAGPLGVGTCNTDPCRPFCQLTFNLCEPAGEFPFPNGQADAGGTVTDCRTECMSFAYITAAPDGGYIGDLAYLSMDNLNCRLYHLESAYDNTIIHPITTHCPHTATISSTCN
jgi:hypothetical protein